MQPPSEAITTVLNNSETSHPEARRRSSALRHRIITIILSWMGMCWLIVGSLLVSVIPGGWLSVAGLIGLSLAPIIPMLRWFGGGSTPNAWARLLVIRPFWYTQLALPLLAIGGLVGIIVGLPWGASGAVGRAIMLVVGSIVLLGGIAGFIGSRRLVVRNVTAQLPTLPAGLAGLKIVQISDLHVGPHTSRLHLTRIRNAVEAAHADLIVITGDQVDDYVADVTSFGAAFGSLSAPLGVFTIAGNHDVYAGWTGVKAGLEQLGLRVLVNESETLTFNGTRFWIAGTGDPAGASADASRDHVAPDIDRTLAMVPESAFTLALAHNPVLWPALAKRGVDLTLSGHTHHGQFAIPRLGWSLASPFLEHAVGPYVLNHSALYINPGTNFWGIPFRLGTPPEVTIITLQRTEATPSITSYVK